MELGGAHSGTNSGGSSDSSLHGLQFGKKIYFEDTAANTGTSHHSSSMSGTILGSSAAASNQRGGGGASASSSPSSAGKKGKAVAPAPPPRCQVEGCGEDLSGAKAYYCRHKVCAMHSKAPRVVVGGLEQRFCQQCSRFHQLPEFDQGKRSCRRRLAGHNERRRKPPPGPLSSRYGRLGAFHDEPGRFRSFLLDFSYPRVPSSARDVWPGARGGGGGGREFAGGIQWQGGLDPHQREHHHHHHHGAVAVAYHHPYSSAPGAAPLFSPVPELPPPGGMLSGVAADSSCALSLLSTQPWGTATSPNNSRTATASHRPLTMAPSGGFGVGSVSPSVAAGSYVPASSWGSSRSHVPSPHHEVGGFDEVAAGSSHHHGQFSGELELALQGNRPPRQPNIHQGGSSNAMHWSL